MSAANETPADHAAPAAHVAPGAKAALLLVAVTFLAPALGYAAVLAPPFRTWPVHWALVAAYGSAAAQAALLACWLGFGVLGVARVLAFALAVAAIPASHLLALGLWSGSLHEVLSDPQAWQLAFRVFVAPCVVATLVCLAARSFGWRWRGPSDPPGSPARFSIRALLAIVCLAALWLALVRATRAHVLAIETAATVEGRLALRWFQFYVIGLGLQAAALPAIAASVGPRGRTLALLASLFVGVSCSAVASLALTPMMDQSAAWSEQSTFVFGGLLAWSLTAGVLALARFVGWRIDRGPSETRISATSE